ncbi:MAG: GNAT family N-acetyltransferase [Pseudomonadota bacterium]
MTARDRSSESEQCVIARYDADRDAKAVAQIWLECGWIEELGTESGMVRKYLEAAQDALVARVGDQAECCVISSDATVRYDATDLSMGAVTGVTTSWVARKTGLASSLTALLLRAQANRGHAVSILGMFEEGFYNRVGFGSGGYEYWLAFDPASLMPRVPYRQPRRLTTKDHKQIYTALINRQRQHGGVNILSPDTLKTELKHFDRPMGLGYFDGPGGTLSHFVFGEMKDENGPFEILMKAWQSPQQLLELVTMLASLGDQIDSIEMQEPGDIQFQDLLKQPIRHRRMMETAKNGDSSEAMAVWQLRILDLAACISTVKATVPCRFNLELTDPVEAVLGALPERHDASNIAADSALNGWSGVAGNYIVNLDSSSHIETGSDETLPSVRASVSAFSRLWFGTQSASSLMVTDDLSISDDDLTRVLDEVFRQPRPHLGWDF